MNASPPRWFAASPLPLARAGYSAGILNGRYVVAGGTLWEGSNKVWTSRVDVFDPVANTWSRGVSLPEPRGDATSATLDGALYVLGGGNNGSVRSDVIVFRNGAWTPLPEAAMPEPRVYAVAVAVGDYLYVLGGMSRPGTYETASNSIWRWSPKAAHAKWESLPSWPGPGLISHAVAVFGQSIFVFGGAKAKGTSVENCNSVFEFDCRTGRWTRLPDLPIARRCWSAVPVDDKAFLIGGYTGQFQTEVFEYGFRKQSFRELNALPHAVCDAKFFRIGQMLVGAGGEIGNRLRSNFTFEYHLPSTSLRPFARLDSAMR